VFRVPEQGTYPIKQSYLFIDHHKTITLSSGMIIRIDIIFEITATKDTIVPPTTQRNRFV